jgi:hypothetical protein
LDASGFTQDLLSFPEALRVHAVLTGLREAIRIFNQTLQLTRESVPLDESYPLSEPTKQP